MIRRLRHARDGVTAVEFALLAPFLLVTVLGLFDMGFNVYAQTMLQGAVQEAARSSTVKSAAGNLTDIDTLVTDAVKDVIPDATMSFARQSYANFTDVGLPEDYTDTDGDGACDNGEPYEDANDNGSWDADRGSAGLGGARDAVLYTVTATYPRLFPMAGLIGLPETVTMKATTVLRNQPYQAQAVHGKIRNCP
ncbi:TadE/TadG family type IV pilus assembly protein [Novosphingobium sp. ZN18A2]|uniref:TadE/TadG family type IV pilus assembly protein n=1 Tax=Novosphingobium sp. ZN18A2 TaxID=3079861 RepID=UPI0030D10CBB